MSLSVIALALLLFFLAAGWLGWFAVTSTVLGVIALITAILLVFEGGPLLYKRFSVRK